MLVHCINIEYSYIFRYNITLDIIRSAFGVGRQLVYSRSNNNCADRVHIMYTDTVTYCRCLLTIDMFDESKIIFNKRVHNIVERNYNFCHY